MNNINEKAIQYVKTKNKDLKDELVRWSYEVCQESARHLAGKHWEDASQDAIEVVLTAIDKYDPTRAGFTTYIKTCIRYAIFKSMKRMNKPKKHPQGADDVLCMGYFSKLVEELPRIISEDDLEIVVAHKVLGYTLEEIGRDLGISKQALSKKLKTIIEKVPTDEKITGNPKTSEPV